LHSIIAANEEQTNGELEDWAYCWLSFFPTGQPEDPRSRVARDLQYVDYGCALGAYALEPSDFCNIGVNKARFPNALLRD
jgi:hypothetical protein